MASFDITIAESNRSSAYQLDARSKLFITLIYSVCLFFDDSWISIGISALFFLISALFCRVSILSVLKLSAVVYLLAIITLACNSFAFIDGSMRFVFDGMLNGIIFALRILLLVWMSLVVCLSTSTEQMCDAISSLIRPLSKLGVPVDDIAMTFAIAIRFIPQTVLEFIAIKEAQWSRGASFDDGNLFFRLKSHVVILLPMLINLFRRSDLLARSMDCRCYGLSDKPRGHLYVRTFTFFDTIVCLLCAIVLISNAVLFQ